MCEKLEIICKYLLLAALIVTIVLSVFFTICLNAISMFVYTAPLLLVALIATALQGIIGIVGWVMLHLYNERGKRLIVRTFSPTLFLYGLYSLFLIVTLFFPDSFPISPVEMIIGFYLFLTSVIILPLQHFWTRNLY